MIKQYMVGIATDNDIEYCSLNAADPDAAALAARRFYDDLDIWEPGFHIATVTLLDEFKEGGDDGKTQ